MKKVCAYTEAAPALCPRAAAYFRRNILALDLELERIITNDTNAFPLGAAAVVNYFTALNYAYARKNNIPEASVPRIITDIIHQLEPGLSPMGLRYFTWEYSNGSPGDNSFLEQAART